MLRLIGLVVVVLLVLSLAHGERTGNSYDRLNSQAETLVDQLTGALADGLRGLGDLLYGPANGDRRGPDGPRGVPDAGRDVPRTVERLARSADVASRRALASAVLRSCPSLGLVCRPDPAAQDPMPDPYRRGMVDDEP